MGDGVRRKRGHHRSVIPGVWAACLLMLIPLRVVPKVDVAATARLTGFFVVLLVLFLAS